MSKGSIGQGRETWLAALGLLLLSSLTFAPRTFELGLVHDDWPYFHDVANGSGSIASPGGLRPLHALPWRLCGLVFGDFLPGYYAVLFALQWLAATVLYVLARRFFSPGFAAAFAALTMIYPGDASHLWLASMPQRTAWLLALTAVALAERQRARDSDFGIAAAAGLGLLSLAIYELHFFLLALWPLMLSISCRIPGSQGGEGNAEPWRRRQLLIWAAIPGCYLLWRFAVHPLTGGATIVNTDWLLEPLAIVRRGLLLVPYNLFGDGWWIGAVEVVRRALLPAVLTFCGAAWVGSALFRQANRPTAGRCWLVAVAVTVLGAAPVIPTTYWLGRTAGTFAGRILACALPGAALLLLLAVVYGVRGPRLRALAFAALVTVAAGFHWNVARLAADHWVVQERLAEALHATASEWPPQSFLVLLDLPPNRLGYDTPWGVGRMIRETYGAETLSGIGLGADRAPGEVLAIHGRELLVHGGAFATVPLARVIILRWQDGNLETVLLDELEL